ncbi:hypothetical protein [Dysosmobacter sp.]
MNGDERRRNVLTLFAKAAVVLGGLLLAVTGWYAGSFCPSPHRVLVSGGRDVFGRLYNFLMDLAELCRCDPAGGALAAAAGILLLAGVVLRRAAGRRK